jgi:acyl-CoA reductase-like NAD-dependent aldehyde dehydrogenase
VEKAAQIAHGAVFANHGQCCVAATRTYVQSGIYDKFVAKAAELAKKRTVGNPYEDVDQGPQVKSGFICSNIFVLGSPFNMNKVTLIKICVPER